MHTFNYTTLVDLLNAIKVVQAIGVDYELQTEEMTIITDELTDREESMMWLIKTEISAC